MQHLTIAQVTGKLPIARRHSYLLKKSWFRSFYRMFFIKDISCQNLPKLLSIFYHTAGHHHFYSPSTVKLHIFQDFFQYKMVKVWFPNMYLRLISVNTVKNPPQAVLTIPPKMTKTEVKEYLTKIYNINVLKVATVNFLG